MPLVVIDRESGTRLQEQIYRQVRDRIIDGALGAGARLPSSRELAVDLGVARNTATLAYEWLAAEGYIERRGGTGTFVAEVVTDHPRHVPPPIPVPAEPIPEAAVEPPALNTAGTPRPAFDFWYARPDQRLFPAHVWKSLGVEALGGCAPGLTEYGETGGDPRLRRAVAAHLAAARGIVADPEQVIITTGAQEALNVAARLLVTPGSVVVVETPGYDAAARVFEGRGARVHPGPIDRDGLDPTELRGVRPRLVYVTPSHQFPTGAVMSPARRRALIEHCAQWGGIILEDDYDGEIVFDRPPIAALAAIDRVERTIHIGSFSKTLGGGLRLGYMVVPRSLAEAARATKGLMSYGQSWLDQQILAAFLESGRHHRHLRRLGVAYRERRDATVAGLRALFGDGLSIEGGDAGGHVFCTLPPDGPDAATVAERARAAGVGLHPAEACGVRGGDVGLSRSLLVGFAALTPSEITEAFGRLTRRSGFGPGTKAP